MPLGPYTIFHKAADHLVKENNMRRDGKINPEKTILPVMIVCGAVLEKITEISSLYNKEKKAPAIVISHLEDKAGLIPECEGMEFLIRMDHASTKVTASPGDQVRIFIMMAIKPHGFLGDGDWSINYHQDDGSYRFGFKAIVRIENQNEI